MPPRDMNLHNVSHVEIGHWLFPVYLRGHDTLLIAVPTEINFDSIPWPTGTLVSPVKAEGRTIVLVQPSGLVLIRDCKHGSQIIPIDQAVRSITKT